VRENPNKEQQLEGETVKLPPIILGTYGTDPKKRTVCAYGHFDVQPALLSDGWDTEPFKLIEKNGKLYGRGSTDDKGPVLGWLWVVDAYQKMNLDLPVNLKFVLEGMEESGSDGLDELVVAEAGKFLKDVDYIVISDSYWLGTTKPCVTYGLRGVSYFKVTIHGPAADLHSGVFGGTLNEPMIDGAHLMSKLVAPDGTILIKGIMDDVAPLTEAEKETYKSLDFSLEEYQKAIGSQTTVHPDVTKTLMHRWRYPSLSFHGIEGAFYSAGAKTVIPATIALKFSLRLVPNQEPTKIYEQVKDFVESEFKKLGSKNTITVEQTHSPGKAWLGDVTDVNFTAARQACERVYGVKPDLIREGGSIPVTLTFAEQTGKSVVLLPMGSGDDGAHSINEKIDRRK
jgi:Cys-Gly metallodipeptidase DUG1